MHNKNFAAFFFASAALIVMLFAACAQVVTPDGGPKDVIPPRVVRYSPDSAATNFKGSRIVITFDEYIALNDLNKQLIISPGVKRKPEVTIRKKDLIIQFKDSLAPNTTYSISFGTAIRDITETNVLNNFRYVFSTGPVIDSLKMSGTVVNAQTLQVEKNVLVMLYRNTGDSVPVREKPYYYTRTDDNGHFMLTNLAAATYKIFALNDEGEDYLYNSPEERIAFTDSLIALSEDVDSLRMYMFRDKSTKQRINKYVQLAPGRYHFEYNLPVPDPSVEFFPALPPSMQPFIEYSTQGDTIDIWMSKVEMDTIGFIVKSGNTVLDTIVRKVERGSKKPVRQGSVDMRALRLTSNATGGQLPPGQQLTLVSTNPIRTVDSARIILTRGRDTLRPLLRQSDTRHFTFANPFPEDSSFSLFIPPGTFTDWYGQKNDTVSLRFNVQAARLFGNLSVNIPALTPGSYLLQVLNEKDQVVRDTIITGAALCRFPAMRAGNYRIRLVYDTNKDLKWTPGNYLQKKQPERVIYYNGAVKIRAGWDMDIVWKME